MLATFRVHKDKRNPYICIHKGFLSDKNLSWRSKGILTYLLSKPDHWIVQVTDIRNQAKEADRAVRTAIKELLDLRYLRKRILRDQSKRFTRFEYDVYESPSLNPEPFRHFSKMAPLVSNEGDRIKQYHDANQQAEDISTRTDVENLGLTWSEDHQEH